MKNYQINGRYQYDDQDLQNLIRFYRDKNIENENVIWADPCNRDDCNLKIEEPLKNLKQGQKLLVPFNTGGHWVGIILEKANDNNVNFTMMNSLKNGVEEEKSLKKYWLNWFKEKFTNLNFKEKNASINVWKQQDTTTCGAWAIENLKRAGYTPENNSPQNNILNDTHIRAHHCNILAEQGFPEKQLDTVESKRTADEKQSKYNNEHFLFNNFNNDTSLEIKKELNNIIKDKNSKEEISEAIIEFYPVTSEQNLQALNTLKTQCSDEKNDVLIFKEQLNNLVAPTPSLKISEIHLEDLPTRELADIIHENASPEFKKLLNDMVINPSAEKWNNLDGKLKNDLDKEILLMTNSQGYNFSNLDSLARLNQFVNHFDNIEDKSLSKNILDNFKEKQKAAFEEAKKISPPPAHRNLRSSRSNSRGL